mmetsp:Transcript_24820/g.51935  ORF Transcript_24820/g.51935 Transcript_24820/m.51935 type:complete len:200 (+) Transcript_24820:635-1234(+)
MSSTVPVATISPAAVGAGATTRVAPRPAVSPVSLATIGWTTAEGALVSPATTTSATPTVSISHAAIVHVMQMMPKPRSTHRWWGRWQVWPRPVDVVMWRRRAHTHVQRHHIRVACTPAWAIAATSAPVSRRGLRRNVTPLLLPPLVTPRGIAFRHLQDTAIHFVLAPRLECRLGMFVRHSNKAKPPRISSVTFRWDMTF